MRPLLRTFFTVSAVVFTAFNVRAAEPTLPVQVMVLGTYHFANPGRDVNNMRAESVLTPKRQAELAEVARAVAAWKPTHVMVEMEAQAPTFTVAAYRTFTPARLATEPNEIDQVGFRIARLVGLAEVQGIDIQPQVGEADYYPYDQVRAAAKLLGQTAILEANGAELRAFIARFEAMQKNGDG